MIYINLSVVLLLDSCYWFGEYEVVVLFFYYIIFILNILCLVTLILKKIPLEILKVVVVTIKYDLILNTCTVFYPTIILSNNSLETGI